MIKRSKINCFSKFSTVINIVIHNSIIYKQNLNLSICVFLCCFVSISDRNRFYFITMSKFQGEYESTVDSKNRFLMPAAVKKQLPESESSFTISRGAGNCLTLYPKSTWDKILNKISGLNDLDPRVVVFKRNFLRGATEVSLDAAGRLNLPASLKEYAGVEKDIVLFGVLSRFEIWDKNRYNKMFDETSELTLTENAKAILDEYKINFND